MKYDRKRHLSNDFSRRAFAAGLLTCLATVPALADIVLESSQLLSAAPNATTRQTMANRAFNISVSPYDYGAVGNGIADDTIPMQQAICAAFGMAAFVGGTGGVSSTSLAVTSILFGFIQANRGLVATGGSSGQPSLAAGTTFIQPGGPAGGGTGTYTLSTAVSIPNGTTLFVSNIGSPGQFLTKPLDLMAGNFKTTSPLYICGINGGHMFSSSNNAQIFCTCNGSEGNLITGPYGVTETPVIMMDGTSNFLTENVGFSGVAPFQQNLITSAVTAAGGNTLHFSNNAARLGSTANIQVGWSAFSMTNPANLVGGGAIVTNVTPTAVTINNSLTIAATGSSYNSGTGAVTLNLTGNPFSVGFSNLPLTISSVTGSGTNISSLNGVHDPATISGNTVTFSIGTGLNITSITGGTITYGATSQYGAIAQGEIIVFVNSTVGIRLFQSAFFGTSETCHWVRCGFNNLGAGAILGSFLGGNCADCQFHDSNWSGCALYAVQTNSFNALDIEIYGGGCDHCGTASTFDPVRGLPSSGNGGGAFVVASGSISKVFATTFTANPWDYITGGGQAMTAIGCRSEGGGLKPLVAAFNASFGGTGNQEMTINTQYGGLIAPGSQLDPLTFGASNGGCIVLHQISGGFQANGAKYQLSQSPPVTATGDYFTDGCFTAQSIGVQGGSFVGIGLNVNFGVGGVSGTWGESHRWIDASFGGNVTLVGCLFGPGISTAGLMANLGSNGTLIAEGLVTSNNANFSNLSGSGGAKIWMRGVQWNSGVSSSLWTNVTGAARVMEYTVSYPPTYFTVANLPAASTIWSETKIVVNDNMAAWSAGAIGNSLTGGGTHTVPAICPDGAGWVMAA